MSSPLPTACPSGFYGPDCALECACQNGGSCNRFSGCVCPAGWHGQHCEKSGEIGTCCGRFQCPTLKWALAPSSPVTGRAIGYWSHQLVQQDPLPVERDSKSIDPRTLQGEHLIWHPSIIAESVAEPSMWDGDQGWTTASMTFPLAPQSGCICVQEKVPGILVPGKEQGQP